jgi:hypothetical protein
MNSSQLSSSHQIGGLCHLVEAATALSELVDLGQSSSKPASSSSSTLSPSPPPPATKDKKKEIFPEHLMRMLSDKTLSDVITWTPNGKSFVILRPDILVQVLPKFLPAENSRASTKYPSFTRKLNRW